MTSFVPAETLQRLPTMSRAEVDALPFGTVQVDDSGSIQMFSRYEADFSGVDPQEVQGRNFFTEVAPCTNNRLFFGRFKKGVEQGDLNLTMPYTYTYKMRPTNVMIHMYRDPATRTNWIMAQTRA